MEAKYYKYPEFLKLFEDAEKDGLKPIFINPGRRNGKINLVDIPYEIRKKAYDLITTKITEIPTVKVDYFPNLYHIEPYESESTDINMWLKVNPFVNVTQPQAIFVKFEKEEKGE